MQGVGAPLRGSINPLLGSDVAPIPGTAQATTLSPGYNGPLYTGYLAIPDAREAAGSHHQIFPGYTGFSPNTGPDRNLPRCKDYRTPVFIQMKLAITEKLKDNTD